MLFKHILAWAEAVINASVLHSAPETDQFAHGHKLESLFRQGRNDSHRRIALRRIQLMHQNNIPVLHLSDYSLYCLVRIFGLPVKRINIPHNHRVIDVT